jgi:hypothetical protein
MGAPLFFTLIHTAWFFVFQATFFYNDKDLKGFSAYLLFLSLYVLHILHFIGYMETH